MNTKSSDLESLIKWAVGELGCRQTHWHLGGKDSVGVAVKYVVVFGGSGGKLFIENQISGKTYSFDTGAFKIGVGAGLIPVTVTTRLTNMPALGGQIYAKQEMKPEDFMGPFTIMQAGGGIDLACTAAIVFFGHMHESLRQAVEDAAVGAASVVDPLMALLYEDFAHCKAFACSLSDHVAANASIGASLGAGYLWM